MAGCRCSAARRRARRCRRQGRARCPELVGEAAQVGDAGIDVLAGGREHRRRRDRAACPASTASGPGRRRWRSSTSSWSLMRPASISNRTSATANRRNASRTSSARSLTPPFPSAVSFIQGSQVQGLPWCAGATECVAHARSCGSRSSPASCERPRFKPPTDTFSRRGAPVATPKSVRAQHVSCVSFCSSIPGDGRLSAVLVVRKGRNDEGARVVGARCVRLRLYGASGRGADSRRCAGHRRAAKRPVRLGSRLRNRRGGVGGSVTRMRRGMFGGADVRPVRGVCGGPGRGQHGGGLGGVLRFGRWRSTGGAVGVQLPWR